MQTRCLENSYSQALTKSNLNQSNTGFFDQIEVGLKCWMKFFASNEKWNKVRILFFYYYFG